MQRRSGFTLRRIVAAVTVAAAGLAVTTGPAHATAPTTTLEQRHVMFALASCGSFTLMLEGEVTRELTTYYDQDGIPVRDVLTRRQQSTFTNSVTGKSVPTSGIWHVTRYYTDGELNGSVTQTGRTYTVTVPGRGVIFIQAGRGIQQDGQTVFEAGPHDFEHANFAELCDYLSS